MNENKLKVEIGQEWIKLGHSIVIGYVDINSNLARASELKKSIWDKIILKDGFPKFSWWEYCGTPIKCNDCNKFCDQKCKFI